MPTAPCARPQPGHGPQAPKITAPTSEGAGGSCSDIAASCQIKEASKIAALNYIPADECHANNGRWKLALHEEPWQEQSDLLCVTGSPRARAWAERVATCSAHACAPGERVEVTGGGDVPGEDRDTAGCARGGCSSLLSDSNVPVLLQPRSCQAASPTLC